MSTPRAAMIEATDVLVKAGVALSSVLQTTATTTTATVAHTALTMLCKPPGVHQDHCIRYHSAPGGGRIDGVDMFRTARRVARRERFKPHQPQSRAVTVDIKRAASRMCAISGITLRLRNGASDGRDYMKYCDVVEHTIACATLRIGNINISMTGHELALLYKVDGNLDNAGFGLDYALDTVVFPLFQNFFRNCPLPVVALYRFDIKLDIALVENIDVDKYGVDGIVIDGFILDDAGHKALLEQRIYNLHERYDSTKIMMARGKRASVVEHAITGVDRLTSLLITTPLWSGASKCVDIPFTSCTLVLDGHEYITYTASEMLEETWIRAGFNKVSKNTITALKHATWCYPIADAPLNGIDMTAFNTIVLRFVTRPTTLVNCACDIEVTQCSTTKLEINGGVAESCWV